MFFKTPSFWCRWFHRKHWKRTTLFGFLDTHTGYECKKCGNCHFTQEPRKNQTDFD